MGTCFYVSLKVKVIDEKGAVEALKQFMTQEEKSSKTFFDIDAYAREGISTDTFLDLTKILLADRQQKVVIKEENGFNRYVNGFDASYGWERVLIEWFEILAPFLADESRMLIYPDEDYDELIIQNGKCIQVH